MSTTLKTKLGAHVVEITAPTLKQAIEEASILAELPQKCGLCGSPDIALHERKAKSQSTGDVHQFFDLLCRDCGADFPLGQARDRVRLFPKGPWQKPHESRARREEGDE